MDKNMNFALQKLNTSALNFYTYVLQEKLEQNSVIVTSDTTEIFKVIENEFNELRNPTILVSVLKILHLTIQQSTADANQILSKLLTEILVKHSSDEGEHIVAMRIVKQVLTSLPRNYLLEQELVDKIIASRSDSPQAKTEEAQCMCLLIEKFQITYLLEKIWQKILGENTPHMMIHYIDLLVTKHNIYRKAEFWKLIATLLLEENRDNRKMGIFFIRKVLQYLSNSEHSDDVINVTEYFYCSSNEHLSSWFTYLTIFENLEEKQSHLILPALQTLHSVYLGEKTPWIRIVILQMLKHNNTLVLRWAVNYLFCNFTTLVIRNEILEEFLKATNNTWLYNETSFQLPTINLEEQENFLKAFGKIPWKSVPMHSWLLEMQTVSWKSIVCDVITTVATRIRQLQNRYIRSNCRDILSSIFESEIKDMNLKNFVSFLDALYSSTDKLSENMLPILIEKIQMDPRPFLSFNLFSILSKQEMDTCYKVMLLERLKTIEYRNHQWFSVLFVFYLNDCRLIQQFCQDNFDVESINKLTLSEAMCEYVRKLSWDEFSKAVIREATVDLFTSKVSRITESDWENLLDAGGEKTLINIANPSRRSFPLSSKLMSRIVVELKNSVNKMVDTAKLIPYLMESCKKDQPEYFLTYVNQILDIDTANNHLALNVFEAVLNLCDFHENDARNLLIRGLLFGEPLCGDARLEFEYAIRKSVSSDLKNDSTYKVRETCLRFVEYIDRSTIELLKSELIEQSKEMSLRKPRYYENSKHHRLKLRIAQALAAVNVELNAWDEYYLFAILQENNQTNVTYVYEFLVAKTISESELMEQLKNLGNLSSSSQSSIFAISFLYCVHNRSKKDFVNSLVEHLLPWTMGSNFNTRLYAQITVYHLLDRFKIEDFDYIKVAIEKGLRESTNAIEKLNTDVRFNFPRELNFLNVILYVTVVPEDERQSSDLDYLSSFTSLKEARRLNLSKRESVQNKETETIIKDLQRKMNPETIVNNGKDQSPKEVQSDMIVVASLIDKLPNLGGIARTCEVLGIKELVLDSAKHAQNKEFKNLSMTAENWIHILEVQPSALKEFLNLKKTEGYVIVGAEQTANSVNFMEFEFPTKCVLLLGHEKEGIPVDLIAFLDYAVEIPQFGMVRSLNVHVTGALFMYEYCKQHLSKQNKK